MEDEKQEAWVEDQTTRTHEMSCESEWPQCEWYEGGVVRRLMVWDRMLFEGEVGESKWCLRGQCCGRSSHEKGHDVKRQDATQRDATQRNTTHNDATRRDITRCDATRRDDYAI